MAENTLKLPTPSRLGRILNTFGPLLALIGIFVFFMIVIGFKTAGDVRHENEKTIQELVEKAHPVPRLSRTQAWPTRCKPALMPPCDFPDVIILKLSPARRRLWAWQRWV